MSAGTEVWIAERSESVYSVGMTTPAIAAVLGWTQANVWLRAGERAGIEKRHPVFLDVIGTIAVVLTSPLAVHLDRQQADAIYFIIDAAALRQLGLLSSQSTRYVDLVVQSHQVGLRTLHRVAHLGPGRRNRGGRQLWP
jgi:hypothetical protein